MIDSSNMFARGAREDIAVMPEVDAPVEIVFRTGGEIEQARIQTKFPVSVLAAADVLAKAAGYISIWSPGREVRQRFIDAAIAGAADA